MTADVFAETVEKCLAAGMNAHLSEAGRYPDQVIPDLAAD
jgi:hypothetical protein